MTAAYGFGGHRTIVDIAGGQGRLLAGILSANPAASGILFDLPHVVAGAEPLLCKHGAAERVRIVEGSFFDAVPEGGDLMYRRTSSTIGPTIRPNKFSRRSARRLRREQPFCWSSA